MRIGLDFDNTIVSYDTLFHKVAEEQGHIPPSLARTKLAVRDHLRSIGREEIWTEMQGYVYGERMLEAKIFDGVVDFLRWAQRRGAMVSIVSHKTRHPILGPKYDLHGVARQWVKQYLNDNEKPLIAEDMVFYEQTKEEKIGRIASGGFDFFVDDLPEIFIAQAFPASTQPILFDPAGAASLPPRAVRVTGWDALRSYMEKHAG
jgi:hypothetical protein